MKTRITLILLMLGMYAQAQVKVGDNPGIINANSLLELESTNKGFLPPRVALTSISSVSPLTGTVPAGMLVYSAGGAVTDGYYYWNGTAWMMLATAETNFITKTATTTLTKLETFVLASNDITLTLPVVTGADDGLSITIKNVGTHKHLVGVLGNSGALIDNSSFIALPRWFSVTIIAKGGNWYFKERTMLSTNTLEVSSIAPWQTLQEAIEFLNVHMWGPTVINIGGGSFDITETQVINLPYSLTIQGASYGTTTLAAATGLANKPMFRCLSECYFKMLAFDATTLSGYGTQAEEDAVRLVGTGTYHEIKDCTFDRFYNTIVDSTDAELWLFECDISNAQKNGIFIHSLVPGVKIRVAETDFINCARGVNMDKASLATIQLMSGAYQNANSTDTAIVYKPSDFTSPAVMLITGNSWNNIGKYIEGFDFSRSDGRDAKVFMENNAGIGDKNPRCAVNVLNNATSTTVVTAGTWYKANWTNTSSFTCKWTIVNNSITYQTPNRRNGSMTISGNLSCDVGNRTISIAIVKNGITTTRYGETTLRVSAPNQPFQFSTVVYLEDIGPGDYFEMYCTSSNAGDILIFQDVLWLTHSN